MIINVDKEGRDLLLQVIDVVLKSKGLEALNLASVLVTKTKYLSELDVPEVLTEEQQNQVDARRKGTFNKEVHKTNNPEILKGREIQFNKKD